jgi:hypothetical protein
MAKRYYGSYEGMSDSKRMQSQDGSMLNDDRSAVANMPQDVKYHGWPSSDIYTPENLDDTIRGINAQKNLDGNKMKARLVPKKV